MQKTRVLIITYYWPPAGGPGVQRWLQFVKHFSKFGIEPVVYVPENPNYPILDPTFLSEVPEDVEIIKTPIKEPYGLAGMISKKKTAQISSGIITKKQQSSLEKFLLFVRGNFFIPDARIGWVKPSVVFLKEYLGQNPVDCIISSGPPHSLHLIAKQLKKDLQLPWIADFRDPWTTIHYHKSLRLTKASEKKHQKMEAGVLNSADRVVVTSPTTKEEFEKTTDTPIEVITNGFSLVENIYPVLDTAFSITHIGTMLSERNPKILWKVLSEIASELPSFKEDLLIKFAGTVSGEIEQSIAEFKLKSNFEFLGYVSHSEAVQLQHNSQLLLLVEIDRQETKSIIPGKLFEYLAAHRPILGLGPKGSDIQEILDETESGKFFSYYEDEALKDHILSQYESFKKGGIPVSSKGIEKYSRKELTRQMAAIIKSL
jgi:hypothetical protein